MLSILIWCDKCQKKTESIDRATYDNETKKCISCGEVKTSIIKLKSDPITIPLKKRKTKSTHLILFNLRSNRSKIRIKQEPTGDITFPS